MTFKDFLRKFSFKKALPDEPINHSHVDDFGQYNRFPNFSENRYEKKTYEGEESDMPPNFEKIQREEANLLQEIIENTSDTTEIKIERLRLWRQQKRYSEFRNLIRYQGHRLFETVASRMDSATRGLEFLEEKITRLKQKQKETTMKTQIKLSINGPQGVGKTTFLEHIKPVLDLAIRVVLSGDVDLILEESNDTTKQDPQPAKYEEDKKEVGKKLDVLAELESKRFEATLRMVTLLKEMGYCQKEIDALADMNESENHNTSCLIDSIRNGL